MFFLEAIIMITKYILSENVSVTQIKRISRIRK